KPALIEVARRNQTADTIAQKVHPVGREMKKDLLTHLIKSNDWHQVLVFTRMKHGANRLVEYLLKHDITAMAIHGNKSQGARTKALADFKSGELQVLVATDIAARGIDIDQLPHVVNFEMPNVPEDYVHRIGRTGRAGAQGRAVSLVCVDEDLFLRDIERLIKRPIPRKAAEDRRPAGPGDRRPTGSNEHRASGSSDRRPPAGPKPAHSNRGPVAPHGAGRPSGPHGPAPHGASGSSERPRTRQQSAALTSSRKDSEG